MSNQPKAHVADERLPFDLVIAALRAIDAEARRRGEMYPQTATEQREDRQAMANVIETLQFYSRHDVTGWPTLPRAASTQGADSRRVTACLKAFEGVSTEDIEESRPVLETLVAKQRENNRLNHENVELRLAAGAPAEAPKPDECPWEALRAEVLHGIDGLDNYQINSVLALIDFYTPDAAHPSPVTEAQGQAGATDAKDAARWRWMCKHGQERMPAELYDVLAAAMSKGEVATKSALDAVIDAAMLAAAPAVPSPAPVAPSEPLNGLPATMWHDEGAVARCYYCSRYSLDPATLSGRAPLCDCGKPQGWSGSFKKPTADAVWSGKAPTASPMVEAPATFQRGDIVRKKSGSEWEGPVVGVYSTTLTPEGYAVESSTHKGSVQIYPVGALELVEDAQLIVAEKVEASGWQRITAPGQVKVGDKLRFNIGDEKFNERVKLIVNEGRADEELIYNKSKNFYVITSMCMKNSGQSKNVEFLRAQGAAE